MWHRINIIHKFSISRRKCGKSPRARRALPKPRNRTTSAARTSQGDDESILAQRGLLPTRMLPSALQVLLRGERTTVEPGAGERKHAASPGHWVPADLGPSRSAATMEATRLADGARHGRRRCPGRSVSRTYGATHWRHRQDSQIGSTLSYAKPNLHCGL